MSIVFLLFFVYMLFFSEEAQADRNAARAMRQAREHDAQHDSADLATIRDMELDGILGERGGQ